MNMDARHISDCLPAELRERIEEIKARTERVGNAARPGVTPTGREEEDILPGNVTRMPLRKGSTKPHAGRPACVVLPFRKSIGQGH